MTKMEDCFENGAALFVLYRLAAECERRHEKPDADKTGELWLRAAFWPVIFQGFALALMIFINGDGIDQFFKKKCLPSICIF